MRISDWSSDVCSSDLWYNGGYRANIVAYTLAVLGDITKRRKESIDFLGIWNAQKVDPVLESAIAVVSGVVNDDIIRPPQGISNISEWCKKERSEEHTSELQSLMRISYAVFCLKKKPSRLNPNLT